MSKIGYNEGLSSRNNVATFLAEHARHFPKRKALSWVPYEMLTPENVQSNEIDLDHKSITFQELEHVVSVLGHAFKELGLKKGDRAIVFIPMSLYLYTTMFALQKIGAIPVFLDGWARRDQMSIATQVAGPVALFSVEKAFQYLSQVPEINAIETKVVAGAAQQTYTARLEELMQGNEYSEIEPVEKEDTALITFTTGSSGTPKGADRTHRFLAAQHYALDRHLPYQEQDKDLPAFPIFSLNNLAAGVETVLPAIDVATPSTHDSKVLFAQLNNAKVSCMTLSPSLLNGLSNYCLNHELTLPGLRRVITGGAPVGRDDMVKMRKVAPNAEILVLYGSTEVEPMAHIEAKEMINQKSKAQDDPEWVDEGVNVGLFDEGLQVKFLKIIKAPVEIKKEEDWDNVCVPKGEVGELIVAGEHVCRNYFNNKEAFKGSKILDHNGTVWHRTGDLGRMDEKDQFWLVGRVHNAIDRAGTYCFPVRSEMVLKKLPFVSKAAYLGMPDKKLGEATFCVITPKNLEDLDDQIKLSAHKKEIKRIMDKNGIAFDQIVFTKDIPMDPRHHSKVEYAVLREQISGKED